MVIAFAASACGSGDPDKRAGGAADPAAAVKRFLDATRKLGDDYASLADACGHLAPSVRPAMRFVATVKSNDRNCGAALMIALHYTGDTGELPNPTGSTWRVGSAETVGDRSFVPVRMTYEGTSFRNREVLVLTTREQGRWWVASPGAFNLQNAVEPKNETELVKDHETLMQKATDAQHQSEAGEAATSRIDDRVDGCPPGGASSVRDATGDVRNADGFDIADDQTRSHDLVEVIHNSDGDDVCFELRFAGRVPDEGGGEIGIRPMGRRVTLQWKDGKIVGEYRNLEDNPRAVRITAGKDDNHLVLRLTRQALAITSSSYRWAVSVHAPTRAARVTHVDQVPTTR